MKKITVIIMLFIFAAVVHSTTVEKKMNILVYPFEYKGDKKYSWVSAGLTDTVISDLNKIKNVSVFSNEDRKKAVQEMELGMMGLFDEKTIVKTGNIMGANIIFTGSIQILGKKIRVNARLINVESTKVENTIKLDGAVEDLFDLQDRVTLGLISESQNISIADIKPVVVDDEDKKKITDNVKPGIAAFELYAKGLEIQDTNPREALNYFKQAIKKQPDYIEALIDAGFTASSSLNLWEESLNYLGKAETLNRQKGQTGTKEHAYIIKNIGHVKESRRDFPDAEKYYLKAKEIYDSLGLQNTKEYAHLIMAIGNAYDGQPGKKYKTPEYYNKSKEIYDNLGLQKTYKYAILIMNIGSMYCDKGQKNLCLEYYDKSRVIYENLGLQKTRNYAMLMNHIGWVYQLNSKYSTAREYYSKAREILDSLGLQKTRLYLNLMRNIESCPDKPDGYQYY